MQLVLCEKEKRSAVVGREAVDDHDRDKRFDRRAVRNIERIEAGSNGGRGEICV